MIQFGEAPPLEGLDLAFIGPGFAEDIDEPTRALATKSTQEGLSVAARLEKQHQDNIRNLTNYLSGRGLLRSGETGFRLGEEEQAFKIGQFDARQKLIDYLSGVHAGFADAQRRAQEALRAGQAGAFDRAIALNVGTGGEQTPPTPTPPKRTPVPETGPNTTLAPIPTGFEYVNTAYGPGLKPRGKRGPIAV